MHLDVAPDAALAGPTAGWHPDPRGQHQLRYHDGVGWTEHVTHAGPVPCAGCAPPAD